jgi:Mg-chelatase subunit ChlD
MVRRGKEESRVSYDQPGLVRLPPRVTLNARSAADDARFAARRQDYMQAWREGREANRAVTVVRGSAQRVYSFDLQ